MNEKVKKILDQSKELCLKLLPPILGPLNLSKEKRISVELTEQEIIICNLQSKKKIIKKLIREKFEFSDSKKDFKKDYQKYVDQISEIVKNEKLENSEVNLLVPTSDVTLKQINMPLTSYSNLSKEIKTAEFWSQFTDLPSEGIQEMLEGLAVSYQVIDTNKADQTMEILFAYTDNSKNEIKNEILKASKLNPTVYEVKCLALVNLMMLTQKIKENNNFLLLAYGENENYLIHRKKDKFSLLENKLTRSDITLLKQLEKLPDGTGPFWDELYDRFLNNVKPTIDEIVEDPENDLSELYIFSEMDDNKNFMLGIKTKFPGLELINMSAFPRNSESTFQNKKKKNNHTKKNKNTIKNQNQNIFSNKIINFNKETLLFSEKLKNKKNVFFFNIGASLRYLNPYNIREPLNCLYKINLNSKNNIIIHNKKILIENNFLKSLTLSFLILFTSVLIFKIPNYFNHKQLIVDYEKINKLHVAYTSDLQNLSATMKKIEAEKILAGQILSRKDEYLDFIDKTDRLVPEGVVLDSIDYLKGVHVVFIGKAASDLDINLFLVNLRNEIGKPELNNLDKIYEKFESKFIPEDILKKYDDDGKIVKEKVDIKEEDLEQVKASEVKTFKIKLFL